VLEYGQRLQYALAWAAEQDWAVDWEIFWTFALDNPLSLSFGRGAGLAGAVEDGLADALDADGDVEIGPDTGVVRTGDDAVRLAVLSLGRAAPGVEELAVAGARLGFDRATAALGRLTAPEESLLDQLDDLPLPDGTSRRGRGR
jgi:hypothetical protein